MSVVNEIFNELDQLRGRLTAIEVQYPDTRIRLEGAIEILDGILTKPTPRLLNATIEELYDLRSYFQDIAGHFPETHRMLMPTIALIDHLLSPEETVQ